MASISGRAKWGAIDRVEEIIVSVTCEVFSPILKNYRHPALKS
jgi:hypothetical protein